MSTRAVIVALVVALLLGGAAWYVTTAGTRAVPRGVVQEGARVLEFDPATLRTVRVSRPSEPAELVRRVEGTPDWELVIGPDTPGAPV
jgi:hypothetical protein